MCGRSAARSLPGSRDTWSGADHRTGPVPGRRRRRAGHPRPLREAKRRQDLRGNGRGHDRSHPAEPLRRCARGVAGARGRPLRSRKPWTSSGRCVSRATSSPGTGSSPCHPPGGTSLRASGGAPTASRWLRTTTRGPRPAEVLVHGGRASLVRRRERLQRPRSAARCHDRRPPAPATRHPHPPPTPATHPPPPHAAASSSSTTAPSSRSSSRGAFAKPACTARFHPPHALAGAWVRGVVARRRRPSRAGRRRCTETAGPASIPAFSPWASPILGICYGMQLLAQHGGGRVVAGRRGIRPRRPAHRLLRRHPRRPLPRLRSRRGGHRLVLPRRPRRRAPARVRHGRGHRRPPRRRLPVARPSRSTGSSSTPRWRTRRAARRSSRTFSSVSAGCAADWTPGAFVAESVERIRRTVGGRAGSSAASPAVWTPRWPRRWCTVPWAASSPASSWTPASCG